MGGKRNRLPNVGHRAAEIQLVTEKLNSSLRSLFEGAFDQRQTAFRLFA